MTIDILRCTNPALSLTEDGFPGDADLYGKPSPEDLLSPREAALKREQEAAVLRSKSAPPTEWDEPPSGGRSSPRSRAHQVRTSYSYDKRREGGYLMRNYRYVPSQSFIDLDEFGGSSSSASTVERDPEGYYCGNPDFQLPSVFAARPAGVGQVVTESAEKAVLVAAQNSGAAAATTTKLLDLVKPMPEPLPLLQQVDQPTFILNDPHQGEIQASSFASSLSKNNGNEGGVLVLRPNPVKTVPPISQQAASGGVVAAAPRLGPTSFGATNPQQTLLPQQPHYPIAPAVNRVVVTEPQKTELNKGSEPWCLQASDQARKLKEEQQKQEKERLRKAEEKERLRKAELRKRQEQQCDFPMPHASGRASADMDQEGNEGRDNASANPIEPGDNGSRQQQHSHKNRMIHTRAFRRSDDDDDDEGSRGIQSTPVFERLVTDEVRELQTYVRMVESQNVELEKMRTYQKDLEQRLQEESVQHEQLEATLEAREREWLLRFEDLELEIRRLNGVVKGEESKNRLLLDQIRKKDQDIQGMLKKKYDNEGPNPRPARGYRSNQLPESRSERMIHPVGKGLTAAAAGEMMHRSPDDYLRLLGSTEKVRERNTRHLLMDFFGM